MKKILLLLIAFMSSITMMMPSFVDAGNSAFGKGSSVKANGELSIGGLNGGDLQTDDKSLDVIKGAVNWVLGLGGLIALIMLIYGGVLMVTSQGNEEGYSNGFKVVKAALIGIGIIGVAWFVVSLGLRLAQETGAGGLGGSGTET